MLREFWASGRGQRDFVERYNTQNPGRKINQSQLSKWQKAALKQENPGGAVAPSQSESFDDRSVQPVQLPQQQGQPVAAPYGVGGEEWVPAVTRQLGALSVAAPAEPSALRGLDPWLGAGSESGSESGSEGEEWAAGRAGSLRAGPGQSAAPPSPPSMNPLELLYGRGDRTASGGGFAGPSQTAGYSQYSPAAYGQSSDSTPYTVSYTQYGSVAYSQSFGASGGGYSGQGGESSAPQPPPADHGQAGSKGKGKAPGGSK